MTGGLFMLQNILNLVISVEAVVLLGAAIVLLIKLIDKVK